MYLLFLDEFGEFSDPRALVSGAYQRMDTRPICGYAGILIPAANYRHFCDDFMELRIIATHNMAYARYTAGKILEKRITFDEFRQLIGSNTNKIAILQQEIKGSQIFSTSFLAKNGIGLRRKKRNVLRYARMFLHLLESHSATVFYSGILKDKYFNSQRNLARPLHVELVRNALDVAYKIAQDRHSQIKLIFDHHQKDDETRERIKARQDRIKVYSMAKYQTRQEYSREILLERAYYNYIKEPVFNIKSDWSLGVQAADWVCSLLGKIKTYEINDQKYSRFRIFYKVLNRPLSDLVEEKSTILFSLKNTSKQLQLPLVSGQKSKGIADLD